MLPRRSGAEWHVLRYSARMLQAVRRSAVEWRAQGRGESYEGWLKSSLPADHHTEFELAFTRNEVPPHPAPLCI